MQDSWAQDVAETLRLAPLSPSATHALLPAVELQIRRLIQQAHKFQRRAKSGVLKVEDVNLALSTNRIEPIYGLHLSEALHDPLGNLEAKAGKVDGMIALVDFANRPIPPCPIRPQIALHWLAVQGIQPTIVENPHLVTTEVAEKLPSVICKETQFLYARMTGILAAAHDTKGLQAVNRVLESDPGIQDLVPYLSRFFYSQIKTHTKRLVVTRVMIRSIRAMHENPAIALEAHLQQLLPAVFTCVVSAKLCLSPDEDHWSLREAAADLIASLTDKYSGKFPDLLSRVCKTYTDALAQDKPLVTVFGGIVGLRALGTHVTKTVLLDQLPLLAQSLSLPMESLRTEPIAVSSLVAEEAEEEDEGGGVVEKWGTASRTAKGGKNPRGSTLLPLSTSSLSSAEHPAEGNGQKPQPSAPITSTATTTTTLSSSAAFSSSSSLQTNKSDLLKKLCQSMEQRFAKDMCREALRVTLGKYMMESLRAPNLPWIFPPQRGERDKRWRKVDSMQLVDLEESLVPFYSVANSQLCYCNAFV